MTAALLLRPKEPQGRPRFRPVDQTRAARLREDEELLMLLVAVADKPWRH